MSVGWVFWKKMEGNVVFVDFFGGWFDYDDGLWCYFVGVCGEILLFRWKVWIELVVLRELEIKLWIGKFRGIYI